MAGSRYGPKGKRRMCFSTPAISVEEEREKPLFRLRPKFGNASAWLR